MRLIVIGVFARFSTSTRYCTEKAPVMCRAASAMLEICVIWICGSSSGACLASGAAEAQPMRINESAANLFDVLQHLLGGRGVFAIRIELDVFLQIRFCVRIFSEAHVEHTELVV